MGLEGIVANDVIATTAPGAAVTGSRSRTLRTPPSSAPCCQSCYRPR